MMKNKKLAIAIPTYNRAEILKENLLYMMDDVKKYNIPIYISDDSNNDDTRIVISELKNDYEYIYYYKNEPSLGHDENCFATLNLPEADYVWYLGDSVVVEPNTIKKILEVLQDENIDFIFINEKSRKLDKLSGIYDDKNKILLDFGWHLTQTGATIYSKKSLLNIPNIKFNQIKNFPQFALIFKSLSKESKVYWMNEKNISTNSKKKSYWNEKVFEVFLSDWINVVNSLDNSFTQINKEKCILNHSYKTNLFSLIVILKLRALGAYHKYVFNEYKELLHVHSRVPNFVLYIITIFPEKFLLCLIKLIHTKKKKKL